jgi:hypothetical protein
VRKLLLLASVSLAGLHPNAARADEAYFVVIFGSQRPIISQPNHTHSFATFIRLTGDLCQPASAQLEAFTISWLPQTMEVRVFAFRPECGANFDLPTTLNWACDDGQRISFWGPFQIDKCLYDRALWKFGQLNSGSVQYKAVDTGYNSAEVSNCIHAVADVVQGPRLRIGTPGWGQSASYFLTLTFQPYFLDGGRTHDWLLDRLGLGCWRLIRRDLDRGNPTVKLLLRGAQNLRHWRLR